MRARSSANPSLLLHIPSILTLLVSRPFLQSNREPQSITLAGPSQRADSASGRTPSKCQVYRRNLRDIPCRKNKPKKIAIVIPTSCVYAHVSIVCTNKRGTNANVQCFLQILLSSPSI